jgi:hypothetical protein
MYMRSAIVRRFSFLLLLAPFLSASILAEESSRIQLHTDFSEAEAALAILDKRNAAEPIADLDWRAVFLTEPYQRLKKRETAMHREFTEDDFKKFLLGDDVLKQRAELARTVRDWKQADLRAAATRAIRTKVFPMWIRIPRSFSISTPRSPARPLKTRSPTKCITSG